ncbi:hypothetical protein LXL04_002212 [Taraxacum kok-saghyz]
MSSSRTTTMSEQDRSTGASINDGVCKGWKAPFRRCYCGVESPCVVSWSMKNPGRRFYGCSSWYKDVLNELKSKKKKIRSKEEIGNPRLLYLVKVRELGLILLACFRL